jgi:phospholipase C
MAELTRRSFIGGAAAAAGAAAVASAAPGAAAQAATQARPRRPHLHGDIRDIKHVVILMQENRSFDHYFGSLKGVRGYDENDGQFDHVPPPVAPAGTTDELFQEPSGGLASAGVDVPVPVGLGFRVPLLLISPWTRGGWVTSEVSDHTSVIQLLEKWTTAIGTPAICPNISDWRRSVCGDLTSAFDFRSPVFGLPELPVPAPPIGDPPGGAYNPPATTNQMPVQEPGTKRARPLPYQPNANLDGFTFGSGGAVTANLSFSNTGRHVSRAS